MSEQKKVLNAFDRNRLQKSFKGEESRTNQSMAPDTDINNIMKRYEKTGLLDHVNRYQGDYGDFTNVPVDYHDAMNIVRAADEMFMSLPATVRSRFENDPGKFLAFVENPENASAMVEMGLASSVKNRQGEGATGGSPEPSPVTPSEGGSSASPGSGEETGGNESPPA